MPRELPISTGVITPHPGPLPVEGRGKNELRVGYQYAPSALYGFCFVICMCGTRDVLRIKSRNVGRVPSPLNGEKVAEGRMRGGHIRDFSLHVRHDKFGVRKSDGSLSSRPSTLTYERHQLYSP
jgi:hypothetical protein